jgi:malate dehydrogenase
MLNKIGIIGGGAIGGVLVQEIVTRRLARNVGFMDPAPMVNPNDPPATQAVAEKQSIADGKALDILEGLPILGRDVNFMAGKDYSVIEGAELIISTAGVPRKARADGTFPSREELLSINLKITKQVAAGIKKYAPNAIVINVANPLDAIVYTLGEELDIPKNKLMGMAGVLDSTRYRYFVADAANVSVENVNALVMGGHGDDMVPVRSTCQIAGLPVSDFLSDEKLKAIEIRTRKAGGEIVGRLGIGSAFASTAWATLEMAEAIIFDKRKVMAVSAYLSGEYGAKGLFVGVPVILGKNGIEKIVEVALTGDEKAALAKSIEGVRSTCNEADALLKNL